MIDLKTMLIEGEEGNLKLSVQVNRRTGYLACLNDVLNYIISGDNVSKELKHEIIPFLNDRCINATIATRNDHERIKELEDNMENIEKRIKRRDYC